MVCILQDELACETDYKHKCIFTLGIQRKEKYYMIKNGTG